MKEEAKQRADRLGRIRLKDKVDMVLAKGETPYACKWNTTDRKVMIQWFKWDGDKSTPKNKYSLLLFYRETCTSVVESVTYLEDDDEATASVHYTPPP
jgi:hypothetical protein